MVLQLKQQNDLKSDIFLIYIAQVIANLQYHKS